MARGSLQLILYRIAVYFYDATLPIALLPARKLIVALVLGVLLYLRVSGAIILRCRKSPPSLDMTFRRPSAVIFLPAVFGLSAGPTFTGKIFI